MRDTGHDGDALRVIPLAASGYEPVGVSSFEKVPYLDWSNKTGNGSLYATLDDLYRFDRALNTEALLKKATRDKYFVEGRGNRFGWFQRKRSGHRIMSSNGRSPGFTAQLDRFPEDDATVIVLSNSYSTISQDPIAAALGAIVLGDEPEKAPELRAAAIPQATLASYAGQYQYGPDYFVPNAQVTIAAEDGSLLLSLGTFRMPLVPLSTAEFFDRIFLGHIVMSLSEKGKAQGFTYRYSGREFVAHRVDGK
jgi:CubicO group peptidase (beta-lactamase class C family)